MNPGFIVLSIINKFRHKKILLWGIVLAISASGPLINTYIFSRGIYAIETRQTLRDIILIFFLLFLIAGFEAIVRVGSKTRLQYYTEKSLIEIQKEYINTVGTRSKNRKPIIQAIRNLTIALGDFAEYFINGGIAGFVSFVSVPFILFFIDKKIFIAEIILIVIYTLATYLFARKYERKYEKYDEETEKYFSKMILSNDISRRGRRLVKSNFGLQNIRFYEWTSVQNMCVLFQFIVAALVVIDIVNGTKGISDLVLIIGYTKESQVFLNSLTSGINRYMQIKAGVERLVVVSNDAKQGSISSIKGSIFS